MPVHTDVPGELLTRNDAAAVARTTTVTIDKWLRLAEGPEYIKIGRRVLIPREGFMAWLMGHGKGRAS